MSFFGIKVIDFSSKNAPSEFTQSLKDSGFAVLKNHPIDMDLVNEIYLEWGSFFKSDHKYNYIFNQDKQDGFFPFGSENAKDYNLKDLKEFFQIYPWGQYPKEISGKTKELYINLCQISEKLLEWVELNIPSEIKRALSIPLKKMIKDSSRSMLRIIHYPPLRDNDIPEALRAAAHEDINLLTILCSATEPGLQAMDREKCWHDVPVDPGMIVVNTGDMLQMVTQGFFPSTTHRVINPSSQMRNTARLSMPLFLHPHDHVILSKSHTAESYLQERLEEIGLI